MHVLNVKQRKKCCAQLSLLRRKGLRCACLLMTALQASVRQSTSRSTNATGIVTASSATNVTRPCSAVDSSWTGRPWFVPTAAAAAKG